MFNIFWTLKPMEFSLIFLVCAYSRTKCPDWPFCDILANQVILQNMYMRFTVSRLYVGYFFFSSSLLSYKSCFHFCSWRTTDCSPSHKWIFVHNNKQNLSFLWKFTLESLKSGLHPDQDLLSPWLPFPDSFGVSCVTIICSFWFLLAKSDSWPNLILFLILIYT